MFISLKPKQKSKQEELISENIALSEEAIKNIILEEDEVERAVDDFLKDYENNFLDQSVSELTNEDFSKLLSDGSEESKITGFDSEYKISTPDIEIQSLPITEKIVDENEMWTEIQKRRSDNKGNIYYPKVDLVTGDLVQVSIGDYEEVLSWEEAYQHYQYNPNAMAELEFLKNSRARLEYTTEFYTEEKEEDIIFIR